MTHVRMSGQHAKMDVNTVGERSWGGEDVTAWYLSAHNLYGLGARSPTIKALASDLALLQCVGYDAQ